MDGVAAVTFMNAFIAIVGSLEDIIISAMWPLAVVGAVIVFRDPIKALLARVESISTKELRLQSPSAPSGHPTQRPKLAPHSQPYLDKLVSQIGELEWPADATEREQALRNYMAEAVGSLHLERAYKNMLGSQLDSIILLANRTEGRARLSDLRAIYDKAAAEDPTVFNSFSFESWLSYLKNWELVNVDSDDVVSLTPEGNAFLPYVDTAGYSRQAAY